METAIDRKKTTVMSENAKHLQSLVRDFDKTEEHCVLKIKLSLTRLVIKGLEEKGGTQSRLASELGYSMPLLHRLLHGDENWTVETAGRLLFAIGIDAEIKEMLDEKSD